MATDIQNSASIVNTTVDLALSRSQAAYYAGLEALQNLADKAASIEFPNLESSFDIPQISTSLNLPTAPVAPTIDVALPEIPDAPALPDIRIPTITDAPVFSVVEPTIVLPAVPAPLDLGTVPVAPTVDTDVVYPDEPVLVLPSLPTQTEITIPDAPTVTFPVFSALSPDDSELALPILSFSWSEDDYTDACLFDAIQTHLCDVITNGGTGLNPVVEEAIWNRARNREDATSLKTQLEILDTYASRGLIVPSGIELAKVQETQQKAQDAISTLSRDIGIKQAELEQENLKHAITSTIQLEDILIRHYNNIQQRAFDSEKMIQETILQVYNATVNKFNAQLDLYKTAASVYQTVMQGELNRLEEYKTKIEAQKVIGEVNRLAVDSYTASVNALRVQGELYKTSMDGVKTRLEAEGLKIEVFKGEIDGYNATLKAKQTEVETFVSLVQAETAKTDIYEAQAKAFTARIQGYSANVDAQSIITNADIATAKSTTEFYLARLEAVKTQAEMQASRANIIAGLYEVEGSVYRSKLSGKEVEGKLELEQAIANIEASKAKAALDFEKAKGNSDLAVKKVEATLSAFQGAAQAAAQLMNASTNMINVQAGISASDSYSTQHYYPHQEQN